MKVYIFVTGCFFIGMVNAYTQVSYGHAGNTILSLNGIHNYNLMNKIKSSIIGEKTMISKYYYANNQLAIYCINKTDCQYYAYSAKGVMLNSFHGQQVSAYLSTDQNVVGEYRGGIEFIPYLKNLEHSVIGKLGLSEQFYQYTVYGEPLLIPRGDINHKAKLFSRVAFGYRDYRYDAISDLYILNARDYNPNTKGFMQVDSYAYDQHLLTNAYNYADGNPVRFEDQTGHMPELILPEGIVQEASEDSLSAEWDNINEEELSEYSTEAQKQDAQEWYEVSLPSTVLLAKYNVKSEQFEYLTSETAEQKILLLEESLKNALNILVFHNEDTILFGFTPDELEGDAAILDFHLNRLADQYNLTRGDDFLKLHIPEIMEKIRTIKYKESNIINLESFQKKPNILHSRDVGNIKYSMSSAAVRLKLKGGLLGSGRRK
ncbi:RHS repeat domain-containing protein [Cysteiniphilum halobium]|uniref:RHS repeat domain-containing protein n=1 Tax=Cysteiniphilum halobium TaxID=2219059 RepID=UPI003F8674E6